jgi:small multidrug resistance pump
MNYILMVIYILAAVTGSTLIKYGSSEKMKVLFTTPVVHMNLSLITLLGILTYGISFVLYVILLSRFELSFISPLLVAFVYVLLMFTAFVFFKESFTFYKILGCSFILIGVILVLLRR